ncbi:SGNH/GDSL hydrolase family protein [Glaciimonas immobilis]|uniref:Thermolabile hemolysin n=1 Tax=Glaciimonas immobilis TaxID=728004 RepID=A0A840RLV3_9BURK|nr:SGNH/GDSL hydrolase family protein [Glaciimonas immobilis]KAF3999275.1 SGNH/GDSL hydrolase family protein [Glaciimonas immobilis]MBB5198743.1 thermolabile hemolysin [Glaciimonas immobilis]
MKKILVLCALCSNMALAEGSAIDKPDPNFTHYLSPSGPLAKIPQRHPNKRRGHFASQTHAAANGADTYTYLRCFYRTNNNPTTPSTKYVWGRDQSDGDYYRIHGYWWGAGALIWKNMFYSDVTQDILQTVCRDTLAAREIAQPVAMVAAADNVFSFNYSVWTTDSAVQTGINKIIAFGDSLSDTQNIYNATEWRFPQPDSWFLGRFSDGKTWVEYLADNLRLPLYNWAIGGAGVKTKVVIPGAIQQVQSFAEYMQVAHNYQPQHTLFTLLIGANDLIFYKRSVDEVIDGTSKALQNLIYFGARNILLLNLPNVARTPIFKYKTKGPKVAAQVIDLNTRLTALVASLREQYGDSLHIQLFDTYALFNALLENPEKYKIDNITQSCLDINSASNTIFLEKHRARSECTHPDRFIFWDALHPTSHTHKVLADAITQFLNLAR